MTERPRLLTRNFCLLFVANFIISAIYFLLVTIVARYSMLTYGTSQSMAGLAASIFFIGAVVIRPFSGIFSNVLGLKKSAVIAVGIMLVSCVLYLFTGTSFAFLIVVRLIHGFSFGISTTVIPAIVVQGFPKSYMGTGTGWFAMAMALGPAIGPFLGLLISGGNSYEPLFIMCAVGMAISFTLVLFVKGDARYQPEALMSDTRSAVSKQQDPRRSALSGFFEPKTAKISVVMVFVALSYVAYNSYLQSFSFEIGLEFFVPFTFTAYGICLVIVRPIAGRIMDKRGENYVIYPCYISMIISLILLAATQNPVMLVMTGVFMAIGFGSSLSTGQALITRMVRPQEAALAISTYLFFTDIGSFAGPYLLGLIVPATGYRGMYVIAAAVIVIAILYYTLVHGRKAKSLNKTAKSEQNGD